MPLSEIIKEFGSDLHEIKENVVKLLERDKYQNKRLEHLEEEMKSIRTKLEEEVKFLRTKIDSNKDFVNKVLGAISVIAFIMPLILKFIK